MGFVNKNFVVLLKPTQLESSILQLAFQIRNKLGLVILASGSSQLEISFHGFLNALYLTFIHAGALSLFKLFFKVVELNNEGAKLLFFELFDFLFHFLYFILKLLLSKIHGLLNLIMEACATEKSSQIIDCKPL